MSYLHLLAIMAGERPQWDLRLMVKILLKKFKFEETKKISLIKAPSVKDGYMYHGSNGKQILSLRDFKNQLPPSIIMVEFSQ
jgi:hypothetical protein